MTEKETYDAVVFDMDGVFFHEKYDGGRLPMILSFFDAVICGDMVERSKPAPDIFLKACDEIGVSPQRAFAIEDSYNGIRAAHAGKLRPIMVPDLLPDNEEMRELSEVVVQNLLEVMDYLEEREPIAL